MRVGDQATSTTSDSANLVWWLSLRGRPTHHPTQHTVHMCQSDMAANMPSEIIIAYVHSDMDARQAYDSARQWRVINLSSNSAEYVYVCADMSLNMATDSANQLTCRMMWQTALRMTQQTSNVESSTSSDSAASAYVSSDMDAT